MIIDKERTVLCLKRTKLLTITLEVEDTLQAKLVKNNNKLTLAD